MTKCKECGARDWELIITIWEGGQGDYLYQCKKCKRLVVMGADDSPNYWYEQSGVVEEIK